MLKKRSESHVAFATNLSKVTEEIKETNSEEWSLAWTKKLDNSPVVARELTKAGMQSNLLAAANRLSGVDGGPGASRGSAAWR